MAKRSAGAQKRPRPPTSRGTKRSTTNTRKAEAAQVRRSARLKLHSEPAESRSRREHPESGFPSVAKLSPNRQQSGISNKPLTPPLKRKSGQEAPNLSIPVPRDPPPSKKPRKSTQSAPEDEPEETEQALVAGATADPLVSWVQNKHWPSQNFEPDPQTRAELFKEEEDSWLEEMMAQPPIPVVEYVEINGFRYPLPVKKAPTSLRRKQSDSSLSQTASSDQRSRDSKSTPYRNPNYTILLAAKGSFLTDFGDDGPPESVVGLCQSLLDTEQDTPENSLFRDDVFRRLCQELEDRNEAMVIQDISRLLVPSAKHLALYGDRHLDVLIENVNEAWTRCIPFEGPRPQSDYAAGFRRSAFTAQQLDKLDPLVGSVFETSFFVATSRMYFPFLTCEVKCGAAALEIADRQNAHSMTVAMRGVVELYRAVKREQELNQEILAFSISHDNRSVRIYGHYPVIDATKKIAFYRHLVHAFDFTALNGREKWSTYKFTKSVYNVWMPKHLKRICSAIDQLPSKINFQVSEELPGTQSDEASMDLALQVLGEEDVPPTAATPDTSVSRGVAKRTKKN